jgi:UDP-glucose 4-epimerase
MYSRGSVIPLFVEQLKKNEPLTVTNPSMTRFLMSLDDSVDLVEHALLHAQPGDIFVRKSPASTVGDLAEAVAGIFGVEPAIRLIGSRHGEKLFETLLSVEELAKAEDLGDYYRVPLDVRSLNYSLYFEEGELEQNEKSGDYTSHNTQQLDVAGVMELIGALPEIQHELREANK